MSKIESLAREIARQLRNCDEALPLGEREVMAIIRAVRLALTEPSHQMLRAGWGCHLNVDSDLGQDFARDDYCRLIEAAFDRCENDKSGLEDPDKPSLHETAGTN